VSTPSQAPASTRRVLPSKFGADTLRTLLARLAIDLEVAMVSLSSSVANMATS
jgi:hypothetical protein